MDEKQILLTVRSHPIVLLSPIISLIVIIGIIMGVRYYFDFDFVGYFSIILSLAILIGLIYLLVRIWRWHRTFLSVSEKEVSFRNQLGLFRHNTTELLNSDIAEVSYTQSGFWDTVIQMGSINIKTRSENTISIPRVHHPQVVVDNINDERQNWIRHLQ